MINIWPQKLKDYMTLLKIFTRTHICTSKFQVLLFFRDANHLGCLAQTKQKYICSPRVKGSTSAILTLSGFSEGGVGQYQDNNKNIVDECDSNNGCGAENAFQPPCDNNIVDGSIAVWKKH